MERVQARADIEVCCRRATRRRRELESSIRRRDRRRIIREWALHRQDEIFGTDTINLTELQARRQKLSAELRQIEQEIRQLASTRQQTVHWQQVIDHAETFRRLLGDNLERLSFEERQAVAHCLIKKVIITGEEVDIHFILPFESSPQVINRQSKEPEGAPGHFYWLRLAHLLDSPVSGDCKLPCEPARAQRQPRSAIKNEKGA